MTSQNSRRRVEGVIVRHVATGVARGYMVVWSREYNHSFIYEEDVNCDEWGDAYPCEWKEFEVDIVPCNGPGGIETRAFNLRKTFNSLADPTTRADQCYTDIQKPRSVNVFSTVEGRNTIKFKDVFKVPPHSPTVISVNGHFIENAYIILADLRELQRFRIPHFEAVVELEPVSKLAEKQPWRITQFVFEGKELSLHGWLSRQGFLRHGPGGTLCAKAVVPPDTLRLQQVNEPSRFATVEVDSLPQWMPSPDVLPFGASDGPEIPRMDSTSPTVLAEVPNRHVVPQEPSLGDDVVSQPSQVSAPVSAASSPVTIDVTGIVLHKNGYWFLYSPVMTSPLRVYISFQDTFTMVIGKWYSFKYKGNDPNIGHVLDFTHVVSIEEAECPPGVIVRVFPPQDQHGSSDVVMVAYADFVYDGRDYAVQCRQLGWLSLPEDSGNFADFSKIQRAIVELTASPYGLVVRRAHSSNLDPAHLLDPLVPYSVHTGNEAHGYLAADLLFALPKEGCDDEWRIHAVTSTTTEETLENITMPSEIHRPSDSIRPHVDSSTNGTETQVLLSGSIDNNGVAPESVNITSADDRTGNYMAPPEIVETAVEHNTSPDPRSVRSVVAMIEDIQDQYLIVFCPLPGFDKILVPYQTMARAPFLAEGHDVCIGYWMYIGVYAIDGSPHFTHHASDMEEHLPRWANIDSIVEGWTQRNHEGIVQFRVVMDLRTPSWKVDEFEYGNERFYLCRTNQKVDVRMPTRRLGDDGPNKILGPNGTCKLKLRFWASRGELVRDHCLFLRDQEIMYEYDENDPADDEPLESASAAEEGEVVCEAAVESTPAPAEEESQPAISLNDVLLALEGFSIPSVLEAIVGEGMEEELNYILRLKESLASGETQLSALNFSKQ